MEKEQKTVVKVLELEVRQITVEKEGKKNTFNAYKTYKKDGKKIDLRFTRAVKDTPEEACFIKVNAENMNIDNNRKYPILWVTKIEEILPLEALRQNPENYKEIDDNFSSEEDLPF